MAYDIFLAERISNSLKQKNIIFEEKKMFGGIAFMVDEKMCLGVNKDKLMARIDPDFYEEALTITGAEKMALTGRPMKGFLFIDSHGIDMEKDLEFWVDKCLEYNPKAKANKKKKK